MDEIINSIQSEGYIPGTCNIGKEEIKRRKLAAAFGILTVIIFIAVFQMLEIVKIWRLFLFFPVTFTVIGILQVYMRFCVNFGSRGVYNFGKTGNTHHVKEDEFIKKDKAKAQQMILIGLVSGIAAALLYYFLPI